MAIKSVESKGTAGVSALPLAWVPLILLEGGAETVSTWVQVTYQFISTDEFTKKKSRALNGLHLQT